MTTWKIRILLRTPHAEQCWAELSPLVKGVLLTFHLATEGRKEFREKSKQREHKKAVSLQRKKKQTPKTTTVCISP